MRGVREPSAVASLAPLDANELAGCGDVSERYHAGSPLPLAARSPRGVLAGRTDPRGGGAGAGGARGASCRLRNAPSSKKLPRGSRGGATALASPGWAPSLPGCASAALSDAGKELLRSRTPARDGLVGATDREDRRVGSPGRAPLSASVGAGSDCAAESSTCGGVGGSTTERLSEGMQHKKSGQHAVALRATTGEGACRASLESAAEIA